MKTKKKKVKPRVKPKAGSEEIQEALEEEHRIRKAFKDKDWAEIKSSDSWVIFKVMSEFVEGFEKLAKIGPCVTIFGSARLKSSHPYYKMAEEIAFQLVQQGYGVITGGGPGIMEAGNKGANKAGGKSVGLNIYLPHEQKGNIYIDGMQSPPSVSNDDKAADCTIKMSFGDLVDLVGGKLDGMSAFMTGKLKIEGDMGVAMKLQTILR